MTARCKLVVGAVALAVAVVGAYAYPSVFKTGVTISKPGVQPGYVIFGAPDGNAYAIDVKGEVAMKWKAPEGTSRLGYTRPLENGNLLARVQAKSMGASADGYAEAAPADSVIEFTQEGKVVWQYIEKGDHKLHHDQERLANGNTLMVCNRNLRIPAISKKLLTDDCLIEVDKSGKIVWEWQTTDHFNEFNFSDALKNEIMEGYGTKVTLAMGASPATEGLDMGHMNAASEIPASSGLTDPRFKAGNIIVSYRPLSTLVVIDKETKKVVWKLDNVSIGQHNVQILPAGVPGTGHMLLFDNGYNSVGANPRHQEVLPNSRIVEVNPLDGKIVWQYTAEMSGQPAWRFFSDHAGGVQRLPNGNTLICENTAGRVFEVTPAGEIVWEFVNPYSRAINKIPDSQLYRAMKVPESWLKHRM